MATAKSTLTAVNDNITIDIPTDRVAVAGFQVASGTDTYKLQVTINGTNWVDCQLSVPGTLGGAGVGTLAAAGIAWADVSYAEKVRVIKTIGTTAAEVTLTVTNP